MVTRKLLSDGRWLNASDYNSTCRLTSGCTYGPGVTMTEAEFVKNPSAHAAAQTRVGKARSVFVRVLCVCVCTCADGLSVACAARRLLGWCAKV